MRKNAIVPYFLIMLFGIGLVVALSLIGLSGGSEQAGGDGGEATVQTPEELYKSSCIACHGQRYEGASGPALTGVGEKLSADEIKDVLVNGRSGSMGNMPGGLVPNDMLDDMTEWLMALE